MDSKLATPNSQLFSLHIQQLHLEDHDGVGWHGSLSAAAVSKFRRNEQPPFVADVHLLQAFHPTGDDAARTGFQFELDRLALVERTVELRSLAERAGVV